MAITINTKIDIIPKGVMPVIHLSQYDSDFTLTFDIYSSEGTLTIPSGTTAEIRGTKTDGNGYDAAATVDGNTVTVTGDEQMTAVSGRNIYEIALYYNSKRLNTINFVLDVEHAALDADTITSESVLRELNNIIEGAETATEAATQATAAATAAEAYAYGNTEWINGIKEPLLACFRGVAWAFPDAQELYQALADAAGSRQLISLTATFTQGTQVITATDKLDDLKPFLVVTATYDNGDVEAITDYTLSGSLAAPSATITATYLGVSATFTVAVTSVPMSYTLKSYLEADGTQYMESNLYETDMIGCGTRAKVMITEYSDRAGHTLSHSNYFSPYLVYFSSTGYHRFNLNRFGASTPSQSSTYWQTNEEYEIESYMNGGDAVFLNGTKIFDVVAGSTYSSSNKLYFFTYGAQLSNTMWRFRGRLYYYKIFDANGNKTHDYIPCLNGSNVAGFYDAVTGTFLPPSLGTFATD